MYNHELNTLIANNMGVIHLRVRHYAIAANFFQNAINFDRHIASNLRTAELHAMSSAKSCEILYNLGIAMLHLRRPKEAFQCFLVPLKTYHCNPRLWFRIAEACIMEYEMVWIILNVFYLTSYKQKISAAQHIRLLSRRL